MRKPSGNFGTQTPTFKIYTLADLPGALLVSTGRPTSSLGRAIDRSKSYLSRSLYVEVRQTLPNGCERLVESLEPLENEQLTLM